MYAGKLDLRTTTKHICGNDQHKDCDYKDPGAGLAAPVN